jgi:hypothetical protein
MNMNGRTIPFPNEFTSPPTWSVATERGSGGKYVRRRPRTVGHYRRVRDGFLLDPDVIARYNDESDVERLVSALRSLVR